MNEFSIDYMGWRGKRQTRRFMLRNSVRRWW